MNIYKEFKQHIEELSKIAHLHTVGLQKYLKKEFDVMMASKPIFPVHFKLYGLLGPYALFAFRINNIKTLAINKLSKQRRKASLIFLTRVLKLRLGKDLTWSITQFVTPKSYLQICHKSINKK